VACVTVKFLPALSTKPDPAIIYKTSGKISIFSPIPKAAA